MSSVQTFKLNDGITIPWLAWGNGTGNAQKTAIESGAQALKDGIIHIDTAQSYENEEQTGEAIKKARFKKDDVYVTSKISTLPEEKPVPLSQVRESVEGSLKRLGFVPDLYLIHNPFVVEPGKLKEFWKILEDLKDEGKLKSIGVSNFRPQDLEEVLDGAKYKPSVNQIEFHPYVLEHLRPVLEIHAKHGIVTASYGPLTPLLRHPTGGPLKPILERIASRLSKSTGKTVDAAAVLLLWTRAKGVVAVTASGNRERIAWLAEVSRLPEGLLTAEEVQEIDDVGKKVHFRHYTEHMEEDFPLPNLPSDA